MLALALALLAFQIPARPTSPAVDYANVIPPAELAGIAREIEGTNIVAAVFPSLDGEDPAELTNRILQKWGVGQKGKDDGVLLTLFINDRKWWIEVGYGA